MKYDPAKHHRCSIRLKGYDYSSPGFYFITICVQNRQCLFGEIIDEKMILSDAGKMVEKWYFELGNKYTNVKCREHIVMPDHFHCIIEIMVTVTDAHDGDAHDGDAHDGDAHDGDAHDGDAH
ncbi:MAG TPA: hypothetical protein ENI76_10965, partial [Ignavibacteria bacterium]|nr:hypothetical protein [Ignavibacteria bacterium]